MLSDGARLLEQHHVVEPEFMLMAERVGIEPQLPALRDAGDDRGARRRAACGVSRGAQHLAPTLALDLAVMSSKLLCQSVRMSYGSVACRSPESAQQPSSTPARR